MTFISRHTRLTSLVGGLLTAAVSACLIAFSLVAQRAALQTPGAPAVRPVAPNSATGAPIQLGPLSLGPPAASGPDGGSEPTPSAEDEIDSLLALAETDAPVSEPRETNSGEEAFPPRSPRRTSEGPADPDICRGDTCRPQNRPTTDRTPARSSHGPACRGRGHTEGPVEHEHKRGKGHCGGGGETAAPRPAGSSRPHPSSEGPTRASGSKGNGPPDHASSPGHEPSPHGPPPSKPSPRKPDHAGGAGKSGESNGHGASGGGPPPHANGQSNGAGKGKGKKSK